MYFSASITRRKQMPLGVQLIGAKFDDHRFLGVANWLEKECNN